MFKGREKVSSRSDQSQFSVTVGKRQIAKDENRVSMIEDLVGSRSVQFSFLILISVALRKLSVLCGLKKWEARSWKKGEESRNEQ